MLRAGRKLLLSNRIQGVGLRSNMAQHHAAFSMVKPAATLLSTNDCPTSCNLVRSFTDFSNYDQGHSHQDFDYRIEKMLSNLGKATKDKKLAEEMRRKLPTSQDELCAKKMKETIQVTWIRLSDPGIRKHFMSAIMKEVNKGEMLKSMDEFAGYVAGMSQKPPGINDEDFYIPFFGVTVLVDRIKIINDYINPTKDIRIVGFVSWVGQSSLEVTVKLQQLCEDSKWTDIMEGMFVYVVKDLDYKPAILYPVVAEGDEEKMLLKAGESRQEKRMENLRNNLFTNALPLPHETEMVHKNFQQNVKHDPENLFLPKLLPPGTIWMRQSYLRSVIATGHRNRISVKFIKIISGAFLMKKAYELAYISALRHTESFPILVYIADIHFLEAVSLKSIIYFTSAIVYTLDEYMEIKVVASTQEKAESRSDASSSIFFFLFRTSDRTQVIPVHPKRYSEYMLYIDGRRKCLKSLGMPEFTKESEI